jgi:myo-inositol-1-phosphate synthase
MKAVENNHKEISPSTVFAIASILENTTYINGSP